MQRIIAMERLMADDFKEHLEHIKFEKYLKKIKSKCKNKKIIIYGAGSFFCHICDNYDLSDFNIIGISDMKFCDEMQGKDFLGYKIVPKDKIEEQAPDCILVATMQYMSIIEDFEINILHDKKIKVYPLARVGLWDFIKNIWCN